jgi:multiple sugar transport system permease protein
MTRRVGGTAALWLAPSALGIVGFFLLPLVVLVWLTTQTWDLLAPPVGAGTANLAVLAEGGLLRSLAVTAGIGALALAIELAGGFALAQLLTAGLPGSALVRTLLLLPWLTAPLAVGVVARWIVAPSDGLLARLVGARVDLVADPVAAPVIVALAVAWQGTGFAALVYAGALSAIPREVRLAGALDGLGRWGIAWRLDWPIVAPTTAFLGVVGVVQAFALYDLVVPLTGGGPDHATETIAMRIVRAAWERFDIGGAAVLAVVVVLVEGALIAAILRRTARRSS